MLKRLLITTFLPLLLGIMTWVTVPSPAAQAVGVYGIPNPVDNPDLWLYDQAEELSISTERKLISTLEKLAQDTGKEVRMVMIDRLDYGDTMNFYE
ncbi:MAG: hypothetical protein HC796_06005 [Synechococcaceae cyanobacterium RL_1_2]|nr:hypothetical protein [Synechococcaceae cyanobacterium RL_1_2]